jgi:hypothetical protein
MTDETQPIKCARERINPDFRREFDDIIVSEHGNPHINFLLRELAQDKMSTRKLFQYGMDHLPEILKRPDMKLSTFFLVLSEIEDLPSDASSLALDLMVYCETEPEPDGYASLRPDLIPKEYERILPVLA